MNTIIIILLLLIICKVGLPKVYIGSDPDRYAKADLAILLNKED